MTVLLSLSTLILGIALGYSWRELWELKKLVTKPPTTQSQPAVTPGSYKPANENHQSKAIVTPKTPQLIEFETNERRRREVLGIK